MHIAGAVVICGTREVCRREVVLVGSAVLRVLRVLI